MEDWEKHFREKSLRRSEKERLERRRQRNARFAVGLAIGLTVMLAIIGLAVLR